jgi:hypothetical protein
MSNPMESQLPVVPIAAHPSVWWHEEGAFGALVAVGSIGLDRAFHLVGP